VHGIDPKVKIPFCRILLSKVWEAAVAWQEWSPARQSWIATVMASTLGTRPVVA
jgi:hypothetical protein